MHFTPKLISFFIFLIFFDNLNAQFNETTISIPLVQVAGVGPFYKTSTTIHKGKERDCGNHIGIPIGFEQSSCFQISLHPDQNIFDKSKASLPLNKYEQASLDNTIDTSKLSREKINHTVSIFVGITQQEKIIIFDANQNKDFSDDLVSKFDLKNCSQPEEYWDNLSFPIILNYEKYNPNTANAIQRKAIGKIYPFNRLNEEDRLTFFLESFEHRLGTISIGQEKYNFAVATLGPFSDDFSNVDIAFTIAGEKFSRTENKTKVGKHIRLGEQNYLVEGINPVGDTMFLRPIKQQSIVKTDKKKKERVSFKEKAITGELINTKDYSNQYLLLNFWGTWCSPCVEKIPYLNSLKESLPSEKLAVIGIAKDYSKEDVEKIIKEKNIEWENIFEGMWENKLTDLFKVSSYPTMILYLPNGEGVIRSESPEEIKKLQTYIESLE